jgi:hypothetical protein
MPQYVWYTTSDITKSTGGSVRPVDFCWSTTGRHVKDASDRSDSMVTWDNYE